MNWKPILLVSAALNLALATVCWLNRRPTDSPAARPAVVSKETRSQPEIRWATNFVERAIEHPAAEVRWPRWGELEAGSFGEFRTNLLAIGCPGDLTRDILEFSINHQHFAGRPALMAPFNAVFWTEMARHDMKSDTGLFNEVKRQLEELDARYDEVKREALKGLPIGNELESAMQRTNSYAYHYGHLDQGQQQQVFALEDNLRTQQEDLRRLGTNEKGQLSEEAQRALKELDTQHQQKLGELMNDDERAEWRLRKTGHSEWAGELRGFEPTDDEQRQVTAWKLALDDQHPRADGKTADDLLRQQGRKAAEAELDAQMRRLFGEARYQDFTRASDGQYQSLHDLGERFELPEQTVQQAWQMQRDADAAARKLRENTALTMSERQAGLRTVQAETQQTFQKLLGSDVFQTYRRHGGEWISQLNGN